MDNREEAIPFVNYLKLYFGISEKVKMFKRTANILSVVFSLEENELSIKFTTEIGGAFEHSYNPSFKITIPSNCVLLTKRYNLDASYDISKSHPYFVYKVTSNYIFTNHLVFERSADKKHEYVLNQELSGFYRKHGLYSTNGINIFRFKNRIKNGIKNNTIAHLEGNSVN